MNPNTDQAPQQPPQVPETPPAAPVQEPSVTPPTETPAPQPATPPVAPSGSKALAIWSLTLAIISLVTLIFFFVSGPLALAALILGIIALVKHKPGKGLSIAGVIISAISLVLLPIVLAITLVAYNGISERAKEMQLDAEMRESTSQSADDIE